MNRYATRRRSHLLGLARSWGMVESAGGV